MNIRNNQRIVLMRRVALRRIWIRRGLNGRSRSVSRRRDGSFGIVRRYRRSEWMKGRSCIRKESGNVLRIESM